MRFLDYAYPYADEPTERIPAIEPTFGEAEHYIQQQLEALFIMPCPCGRMPGTVKTYAEERAELARDLLDELQALRRMRFDRPNKVYPKKRKWGRK